MKICENLRGKKGVSPYLAPDQGTLVSSVATVVSRALRKYRAVERWK